jgi:hypothetical protein
MESSSFYFVAPRGEKWEISGKIGKKPPLLSSHYPRRIVNLEKGLRNVKGGAPDKSLLVNEKRSWRRLIF